MTNEAFFHREGERFLPNDICRGPWDPNSLHGRVVAGLLAFEIDRLHGDPAFLPTRLTVDLYRMPRFAPVTVETRIARDGNRIRVVDADFLSDGVSIGRASCVLLRQGENPEGRVWAPTDWDVPSPESIPAPDREGRPTMWDTRPISGDFGALLQKRTWLRENRDLVAGEPLTPFIRAAVACDFTNPFANSGERGLEFVNADITLYLHRLPASEWLGFEVNTHHSHQGIAVAECTLYDVEGALGLSAVCGVGQRRRPAPSGRRD
jgi:hypothetical protein